MAVLIYEIREEPDEGGGAVSGICLAGADGEAFRRLLHPGARCVRTFEASSHFEAMTICNRLLGRGACTTEFAVDREPYPIEWALRQRDTC